jgi:hypothetical protein
MSSQPVITKPEYLNKAVEATSFKSYNRLKMAIIGKPGVGKSRLAVTAPKPVLVYDFDDRRESIAGTQGVSIETFLDNNPYDPTAIKSVMLRLSEMERVKRANQPLGFETLVFDSMTYMCKAAIIQGMKENSTGTKQIEVAGVKFNLARGYEPYDGEYNIILNIVQRAFALGVNVICVFHERMEEDERSTQASPIYTGKVSVDPPRMNKLLPLFNEVYRMTADNGTYMAQTRPNHQFTAKTCLMLDGTEKPNLIEMIQKQKSKETK